MARLVSAGHGRSRNPAPVPKSSNVSTAVQKLRVVVAEDHPDYEFMMGNALRERGEEISLYFVGDGCELLEYLRGEGRYEDQGVPETPALVLIDVNMPRMLSPEVVSEIAADPELCEVPLMLYSTEPWSASGSCPVPTLAKPHDCDPFEPHIHAAIAASARAKAPPDSEAEAG